MKYTLYIGTNKYSLSTEDDILKLSPGNFEYQHRILIGNKDILKSVQVAYKKLFQKAIDKYNKNNPKKEIKSYYCKINESQKQALATGILIKEKVLKLKTKLVIYRNVLGNKNIKDHDLIGIILELIYSNTIAIDEFLEISKETIEYKSKNIRYLDELEKELENIYEILTGDTKKKEAFRKNFLDWVKKYVEYLKNEKKKVI